MSTVLDVKGLRAGYGRTEVLHGIDLRVPEGSVVAVLGSNGAGKTTLLNTIMGVIPTRSGTIRFNGRPVEHLPGHARSRAGICLIPEGRGIFRRLSVRENLLMATGGRQVKETVDVAVAAFPILGDRLGQEAGTLSGGQQQMLAVSRALATDATLVLADELSVGLAPVVVDEIFEAVDTFKRQGRSLVIVEQYVDRVLAIADYVYILHKGSVAFVGEPGQVGSGAVFEQYLGGVA